MLLLLLLLLAPLRLLHSSSLRVLEAQHRIT
jgi:hypothetical protein